MQDWGMRPVPVLLFRRKTELTQAARGGYSAQLTVSYSDQYEGDVVGYSFRRGAIVTFVREDGQRGPGESYRYPASEGWKVEIQDEGCVEITGYLRKPVPPSLVVPWHRIWEISTIEE